MAAGPRYSGWKRDGDNLLLVAGGVTIATVSSTGIAFNQAVTLPQALTIGGIAYTFPADDGEAGEVLQTNGSGVLTWEEDATSA